MAGKFHELAFTENVTKAQEKYYGKTLFKPKASGPDALTEEEAGFIQSRDSFYMATVSETGWPYIQHRGGPPGFLHVLGPLKLAFADLKGNPQMLSTGNLAGSDHIALFLMDYPSRSRLKIMGHARVEDAKQHPELVAQLADSETQKGVERIFCIDVVSFDWNCPQHITPRYTMAEIEQMIAPLRARIAELEAKK